MTLQAALIDRLVILMQSLFQGGGVHDRNVSAEKSSSQETVAIYSPGSEVEHEASCKNSVFHEIRIKYIGKSKASALEHYTKLANIEDAVETFTNDEIEDPSGPNYSMINVIVGARETLDEEDMDRLESTMNFTFQYEYLRGSASDK